MVRDPPPHRLPSPCYLSFSEEKRAKEGSDGKSNWNIVQHELFRALCNIRAVRAQAKREASLSSLRSFNEFVELHRVLERDPRESPQAKLKELSAKLRKLVALLDDDALLSVNNVAAKSLGLVARKKNNGNSLPRPAPPHTSCSNIQTSATVRPTC